MSRSGFCLETAVRDVAIKIVAIGGSDSIGPKVVAKLKRKRHPTVDAVPNTRVNTITGEGLKEALTGAQMMADFASSRSFV